MQSVSEPRGKSHRIASARDVGMNTLRALLLMAVALFAFAAPTRAADGPGYKIVERIKVPDGGFDYATFDAATGNILMARTDFTTVIDTKTGKLSQLSSAARGHM